MSIRQRALIGAILLFGVVAIEDSVIRDWLGPGHPSYPWGLDLVSRELSRVAIFLAAFSGLYFTVYAVTDNNYRADCVDSL